MLHCISKCVRSWSGHPVSYHRLKTFGCEAYAHVPKELCAKLDPKSRNCFFIGYGIDGQFGYCLRNPESQTVICSSDVVFNETKIHRHLEKEVAYRKVTFSDVSPPMPNSLQAHAPELRSSLALVVSQEDQRGSHIRQIALFLAWILCCL